MFKPTLALIFVALVYCLIIYEFFTGRSLLYFPLLGK